MAVGPCQECGAPEVRCKGLCDRCYYAERRVPARRRHTGLQGDELRRVERAWSRHRFMTAMMVPGWFPGRVDPPWVERGACRDRPELPWEGNRATTEMRVLCAECPVRHRCLEEALRYPGGDGVWAGTTPAERARLRR